MPLILSPAAKQYENITPRDDDFVALSGEAIVGCITRIEEGRYQAGKWTWAVSVPVRNKDLPCQHGVVDDLETAKQKLAAGWRAWLDWAGLQEKAR